MSEKLIKKTIPVLVDRDGFVANGQGFEMVF